MAMLSQIVQRGDKTIFSYVNTLRINTNSLFTDRVN